MRLLFWKKQEQDNQKLKEAYFTASQGQLIRARFRNNHTAMVAAWALVVMILMGLFAPFISPYAPNISGRDKEYENGPPQIPRFWDENGFSARPFLYTTERERSIKTNFRWVITENREKAALCRIFCGWLGIQLYRHRMGPSR